MILCTELIYIISYNSYTLGVVKYKLIFSFINLFQTAQVINLNNKIAE